MTQFLGAKRSIIVSEISEQRGMSAITDLGWFWLEADVLGLDLRVQKRSSTN